MSEAKSDLTVLLSAGARRIVKIILSGNVPGLNMGKCATQKEELELAFVGLTVQVERNHHEPRHCYPLYKDKFMARAKELGLSG